MRNIVTADFLSQNKAISNMDLFLGSEVEGATYACSSLLFMITSCC